MDRTEASTYATVKVPIPNICTLHNQSQIDTESSIIKSGPCITVKILKFGTPQTIAIIVLKIEKFDVTLH